MKHFMIFALSILVVTTASAQGEGTPESSPPPTTELQLQQQLEMFFRMGEDGQALDLLERQQKAGKLSPEHRRRLISLYRNAERYADAEALLLEDFGSEGLSAASAPQLRSLAEMRLAQEDLSGTQEALDAILASDPDDPSLHRLVANVWAHAGHSDRAIAHLRAQRARAKDPALFAPYLGQLHAEAGQSRAALGEFLTVVRGNALSLALVRGQTLDLAHDYPDSLPRLLERIDADIEARGALPAIDILRAELRVRAGDSEGAWELVEPLVADPAWRQQMLQMAMAGLADSKLPGNDSEASLRGLRLGTRVLHGLLSSEGLSESLQTRLYDSLNRSLVAILENDHFQDLPPHERIALLDETRATILDMSRDLPSSQLSTTALLRLGDTYVDALDRPDDAATLFRRLSQDPAASAEQAYRARLGLGRSYLAMADTSGAREVFLELGRDHGYREGQARAHYFLGLLDIMGGELATAQDRLASVARTDSRAPYTNDALDLAVLIAEVGMESEEGQAEMIQRFGGVIHARVTGRADSLRARLTALAEGPAGPVQQRARRDLTRELQRLGDHVSALQWASRLAEESPNSRYAPEAMELQGHSYEELGKRAEALQVYVDLVSIHDQYVHVDGIRDRIRELRQKTRKKEELP